MKIRLAAPLQIDSVVDGEGIRTVVWTQGCSHNCPYCHNPQTHSFESGYLEDVEKLKEQIHALKGQDGITFSGGDPLYQIEAVKELAEAIKSYGMDVWLYTGFTFEEVLKMKNIESLLKYIDVIVDGPFIYEEKSLDLPFRGSKNQRIIDVQETLKNNKITLYTLKSKKTLREKKQDIFI